MDDRTELVDRLSGANLLAVGSDEEEGAVIQQVAQQTGQLLFLACKLQLSALQQRLISFVRLNTLDDRFLLYGHMRHVLTDRVLEVAANKQQVRELVINSIMAERCALIEHVHAEQVLRPEALTARQQLPLKFAAADGHVMPLGTLKTGVWWLSCSYWGSSPSS